MGKNMYRSGRIAEKKVVNRLKARGFTNIRRSKGSRGPADIYAVKKGKKYYIQVKSGK
jgi:Holliday junction resolvase